MMSLDFACVEKLHAQTSDTLARLGDARAGAGP